MAGAALDMSLDDLIKNNKKSGGGDGGGRGRGRGRGSGPGPTRRFNNRGANRATPYGGAKAPEAAWKHDMYGAADQAMGNGGPGGRPAAIETGTKLYISNLDYGVSNDDIKELFAEVGDLKKYSIHYDRSGRSKGTAEIVYSRRQDALAAVKRYNNVQLDGKPMKIEIVGLNIVAPAPGLPMVNNSFGNMNGFPMDGGGSFAIPEFRGGNRGSGGIGVDPVLAHSSGHLIPGNYGGQPMQAVPAPWLDQQFCGNGGDSGAFSWNHAPGIPYLQGHITGTGIEPANIGLHGYQVTAGNRNSGAFVHGPAISAHQGPHNLHHPPPPPMPPMQGHNMDFHSQLASTSLRLPANTSINPFQNGMEPGPRFVGPTPPTGLRVYRPHRRELMLEASARHRGFPHLRVLPEDGVAILDISGYHEVGHSVDHHRDMRLDIDHMSYEELLALGEQIGSVGSRLSDDFVVQHLKTRLFTLSKSSDTSPSDQELNSCVICQTNYDDGEQIGVLDCGHEYHVECVKKWLVVKNTCPVCKSTALAGQSKES